MTKKLAARGARGINGLSRQFRIADDNRSMSLAPEEFVKCIHDFRVELNQTDALRLFAIYDRDQSGEISYDEFLRGVVGEMNAFRTNIAM
jgi:Ca2+-binding EF-hand superfamily protein